MKNLDRPINPLSDMQKIFSFALSKKFTTGEDLASIMEVVNATPNPEIATLLLLGLYEEPVFNHKERTSLPSKSDVRVTGEIITASVSFERYDKFNEMVAFSCIIKVERTRWFKTPERAEDYAASGKYNYDYASSKSDSYQYEATFTSTESCTGMCPVESWNTL